MKKCPKCGADNRLENLVCFNCSASLEGVSASDASVAPRVSSVDTPPTPAQPLGDGEHKTAGRGVYHRKSNISSIIAIVILFLVIFGGGGFAYWKLIYLPSTPVGVVSAYAKAVVSGDAEKIKKYIAESNLSMPDMEEGFTKGFSFGERNSGKKVVEGKDFILAAGPVEGDKATVYFKPGPEASGKIEEIHRIFKKGMPIILAKERKGWKIDVMKTFQEMMGPLMIEMNQQSGGNMPGGTRMPAAPGKAPGAHRK